MPQESNDMLEALDEANSDGEIDPEDLEEARMGLAENETGILILSLAVPPQERKEGQRHCDKPGV